ncbi:MAG: hypothetical protein RLZZ142_2473 [Verrucomicrobiota bacterium]
MSPLPHAMASTPTPALRLALALAGLLGFPLVLALSPSAAHAQNPAPPAIAANPARPSENTPNPEHKPLLDELDKDWTTTLRDELTYLHTSLKLDENALKALEALIPAAVQAYRTAFTLRLPGFLEKLPSVLHSTPLAELVPWFTAGYLAEDQPPITEHPLWTEALKQTLSPEQADSLARADHEFEKGIPSLLEPRKAPTLRRLQETFRQLSTPIETALALPPDRSKALQELAQNAANAALQTQIQLESKRLHSLPRSKRKLLTPNQKQVSPIFWFSFQPSEEPVWKEEISKLLSAEEVQKIEKSTADSLRSVADSLGMQLLLALDEACALTATQREKLLPALRAFLDSKLRNNPEAKHILELNQFEPFRIYRLTESLLRAIPDEILRPLLDSAQLPLWKTHLHLTLNNRPSTKGSLPPPTELPPSAPLAEETELAVSDLLSLLAEKKRLALRTTLTARCEDVIRVTGLAPEPAQRLRIATAGTVESLLQAALADSERSIRSYLLSNPSPDPRLTLASVPMYRISGFSRKPDSEESPLWKNALQNLLSPEQRASWQQSTAAREAFRIEAICQNLLLTLEKAAGLRPEQRQTLSPLLARITREYEPDIRSAFSFGDGQPWYRQSWTSLIPLALIPEAELKPLLSPEQWKSWSASSALQTASSNIGSVRNAHENRMKTAKPAPNP